MNLPPLELQSAGFGSWLSRQSAFELAHFMSLNYHKRLSEFFVGDERDLEQSAVLALLEWEQANGQIDRIREGIAVAVIHRAMWDEIALNRRQSADYEWESLPDRQQRNGKQLDMLALWVNVCGKIANKSDGTPNFLMALLHYGCEWSLDDISAYWKRKKDDRHSYKPATIEKHVKSALRRLRKRKDFLSPYNQDLLWLDFQPNVDDL